MGVAGSHLGSNSSGSRGGGADAAGGGGGGGEGASSMLGTTGLRLQKTTNLAAHLITVPATIITQTSNNNITEGGGEVPGLAEDTIEEIARGILRCLKRKKSPPASKVYLVLPPVFFGEDIEKERRQVASERLDAAWQKLERYNDMIGAPKLMADAQFEFVDVILP